MLTELIAPVTKFLGIHLISAAGEEKGNCNELIDQHYPHWKKDDPEQCKYLEKLEAFIDENKDKKPLALFDWDGTLYGEDIKIKEYDGGTKAGQPAWHIWAAFHMDDYKDLNLLPMFRTAESKDERVRNVVLKDDYLEGKRNPKPEGYHKFSQIAVFEAGMTPLQMTRGVQMYLKDYNPCDYAIYPALDVAQRLVDSGFDIWIVTGSNPYYVATVLKTIEDQCDFKPEKRYDLNISSTPYSLENDRIVGNAAKLLEDGTFSTVFEDRFTRFGDDLLIIEKDGKRVAIENYIEPKDRRQALFCGGNSGGDLEMMKYVLARENSMGLFVNARGGLEKLIEQFAEKSIRVFYQ